MKKYAVVYERGETSWGAFAPDIPGCVAVGDTREEVERLFREAAEAHLKLLAEDGDPIPDSTCEVGYVELDVPQAATAK